MEYQIIKTGTDVALVCQKLQGEEAIGLDTETMRSSVSASKGIPIKKAALSPRTGELRLVQLSTETFCYLIDIAEFPRPDVNPVLDPLRRLISAEHPRKVVHNAKFDEKFISTFLNCSIGGLFDTMLSSKLIDFYAPANLKAVANRYLGVEIDKEEQQSDWSGALSESQYEYAARDAHVLLALRRKLSKELIMTQQQDVALIEFEAVVPLAHVEMNGMPVDKAMYARQVEQVIKQHEKITEELTDTIGVLENQLNFFDAPRKIINLNSPSQIKAAYERKGIKFEKGTGKGAMKVLARTYPEIAQLQEYRGLQKELSSYGENMLLHIDDECWRIFADFFQIGANTGRMACREPNVMQVPRKMLYRRCFRAYEALKRLVIADYGQIELRILAHASNDKAMIAGFKSGLDFHLATALQLFGKTDDKAEMKLRRFNGKCFHPRTEVLTRTGWKKIIDLIDGEEIIQAIPINHKTVKLEWIVPLEVFTTKHYSNKLVTLKNEGIDIEVTPDHRMLAFTARGNPKVVMPSDLPRQEYWANAGILEADKNTDERILRLAIATQADGSFEKNTIRFGFTKERKIERLKGLLKANEYVVYASKNGKNPIVTRIDLKEELSTKIKALLEGKSFPWWWLNLNEDVRNLILDEIKNWDGGTYKKWTKISFFSTDRQSIDVIQALASISGRKTRLKTSYDKRNKLWKPRHELSIKTHAYSVGKNLIAEEKTFTDEVACLAVPSTYVLVRSNGVPVVTGQTLNFSVTYGAQKWALADTLGIDVDEAEDLLIKYKKNFEGMTLYMDDIGHQAMLDGETRTLLNRRIIFKYDPDDERSKSHALREYRNGVIQGTSADILKIALALLHKDLEGTSGKIVNLVHDEIIVEVDDDEAPFVAAKVQNCMKMAAERVITKVPITVDADIARSWADKS